MRGPRPRRAVRMLSHMLNACLPGMVKNVQIQFAAEIGKTLIVIQFNTYKSFTINRS